MGIPLRKILRKLYPERLVARKLKRICGPFATKWFILTLLLAVIASMVVFLVFFYNTFLSMQYDVEEASAQIATQLQRRKNIIVNLSLMVRDYAKHEKEIFKHTTETRWEMLEPESRASPEKALLNSQGAQGPAPKRPQGLDGTPQRTVKDLAALLAKPQITGADLDTLLSKIFAIAERYPDLRLSENFQRFMDALVDAENTIAEQRMVYNQRANEMSTAVGKFPGFIFAEIYGFEPPPFFEPEAEARKPPQVEYIAP